MVPFTLDGVDLEAASTLLEQQQCLVSGATAELDALGLPREASGVAVDLGTGSGLQALAFRLWPSRLVSRPARIFRHSDRQLQGRAERQQRMAGLPISAIVGDILEFGQRVSSPAKLTRSRCVI